MTNLGRFRFAWTVVAVWQLAVFVQSHALYDHQQQTGLKQPATSQGDRTAHARLIDLRAPQHTDAYQQRNADHHHQHHLAHQEDLLVQAGGNQPCTKPNGLEAVADDCGAFLNCVHGNGVRQQCGPGTMFSAEFAVCDWPYNVDCGSRRLVLTGGRYAMDVRMADDDDEAHLVVNNNRLAASESRVHQQHYRPAYAVGGQQPEQGRRTVPLPSLGLEAPLPEGVQQQQLYQQQQQQQQQIGHYVAEGLSRDLLPPMRGADDAWRTTTQSTIPTLVANPCGSRYPVIDGNNNRMRCVDQYGGQQQQHTQGVQSLRTPHPITSGPTTFAAVNADGQMVETFVQTRRSNPCTQGLKPIIDEQFGGVRCVADAPTASVVDLVHPVAKGAATPWTSTTTSTSTTAATFRTHPNPCVSNERPVYDAQINRVRCIVHGAVDESVYRTVRNPCGDGRPIYDVVASVVTCEEQAFVATTTTFGEQQQHHQQHHRSLSTADQRAAASVPVPARGLQAPLFGTDNKHREVEAEEDDDDNVGQQTVPVQYGGAFPARTTPSVTTQRPGQRDAYDRIPFIDAEDAEETGQQTQRVEYDFASSSSSRSHSSAASSSASQTRYQSSNNNRRTQQEPINQQSAYPLDDTEDDNVQRPQTVTFFIPEDSSSHYATADQRHAAAASSSSSSSSSTSRRTYQANHETIGQRFGGADDDYGQRPESVSYSSGGSGGQPAVESQARPSLEDYEQNVLRETSDQRRPLTLGRHQPPSSSAITSTYHVDSADAGPIVGVPQQQSYQPMDVEKSALEESMRILDSYSNVRRQGNERQHSMPLYDRNAMRSSAATSANQLQAQTTQYQQREPKQQQNNLYQPYQPQQPQQPQQQQQQQHNAFQSQTSTSDSINTTVLAESMRMLLKPYLRGAPLNVTDAPPQFQLGPDEDNQQTLLDPLQDLVEPSVYATSPTPPRRQSANQVGGRGDQPLDPDTNSITATASTTSKPMGCPQDYWLCETSAECLPLSFLCDGTRDCADSSDETPQRCDNRTMQWRLVDATVAASNVTTTRTNAGRVEVRRHGVWGTVCRDKFGAHAADVLCRSMGFAGRGTIIETTNRHSYRTDPIWLDDVECTGHEANLANCMHSTYGEHNCDHSADVSVQCAIEYEAPAMQWPSSGRKSRTRGY